MRSHQQYQNKDICPFVDDFSNNIQTNCKANRLFIVYNMISALFTLPFSMIGKYLKGLGLVICLFYLLIKQIIE